MKAIAFGAVAVMAAVVAQNASASTWNMTFTGYGLNEIVGVRFNNSDTFNSATASSGFFGVHAGQHNFSVFGKGYSNYCVQLFESIGQVGDTNAYCTAAVADVPDFPPFPGPMGAIKATLVQDLYARYHAGVKASGDSIQHAAFQIALWELTHEKFTAADATSTLAQISLEHGALQMDGFGAPAVLAAANALLAGLGSGGFKSLGDNLFGLTSPTKQDQLVVVPIPAAALLAGVGLLGVGLIRRRVAK